jgi:hypothetical protein
MVLVLERRFCGGTEWVCLKCGRVTDQEFDDDDEDYLPVVVEYRLPNNDDGVMG